MSITTRKIKPATSQPKGRGIAGVEINLPLIKEAGETLPLGIINVIAKSAARQAIIEMKNQ